MSNLPKDPKPGQVVWAPKEDEVFDLGQAARALFKDMRADMEKEERKNFTIHFDGMWIPEEGRGPITIPATLSEMVDLCFNLDEKGVRPGNDMHWRDMRGWNESFQACYNEIYENTEKGD